MEGTGTSKDIIMAEEWKHRLKHVNVSKEDMNALVMNFLIKEGYGDAAEKFTKESGAELNTKFATLTLANAAKHKVEQGDLEDAILTIKNIDSDLLDKNPQILFHLQQQRFVECIRDGKLEEALEFAQRELAPMGEKNQELLEELESTLVLLSFEDEVNCPVGDLLDATRIHEIANEVNAAILTSQSPEKDSKLPRIVKMLESVQDQLDQHVIYPRMHIKDDC